MARLRRQAWILAFVLAASGCSGDAAPGAASERVVLVSIEALRPDHVACYGAAFASTPTLDALALRGARFETAISPAPLTLPAHATLLTGFDPPEHGVRNDASSLREEIPTLAERMHAAGFASAAFVSTSALDPSFGLARGFDLYEAGSGIEDTGAASRPAGITIDLALAWLEHAPRSFFLFVQLDDPHAPYAPPEPYRARAAGRPYDGEISYADAELGRLLAALDTRFPDGRTLVVVTADHGESLGQHGEETHGYGVYDATQRVPLLLAGRGVPAGRVVTALARLADVTPTLLELAGLPAATGLRGSSLAPALRGEPEQEPRVAWVETLATQLDLGWSPLLGVRTATHKYIRAPHPELYALADDPGETKNLAAEQPALAARLDALVAARAGTPLGGASGLDPKAELARLARLREALAALSRDRGPEALEKLRELGELGPDLERLRGEAALLAGEFAQARASALRARELEPAPTAPPLVLLGRVEEAAGRLDAAETAFLAAHDLDPESGAALLALGRVAERRGDRAGARARYEAASRVRLVEPEALWRLAALEIESGEPERARQTLADLPQRVTGSPAAAARLADAERVAGRLDLARVRVQGPLRAYPESAELRWVEGELLEDEGKAAEALGVRQRAHDAAPGDAKAGLALARSLALAGERLDQAPALAEPALAAARSSEVLETVALIRAARGEYRLALALADEGLAAQPQGALLAALRFRRAEALAGLGRTAEAQAALAEAVGSGPPGPRAQAANERVERLLAPSASWGGSPPVPLGSNRLGLPPYFVRS